MIKLKDAINERPIFYAERLTISLIVKRLWFSEGPLSIFAFFYQIFLCFGLKLNV
jgi:hypothetical protein